MVDIYNAWVDLGIDGFRIDTVKHVNNEFWQKFGPALMDHAAEVNNDDFFMFGEVYDSSPSFTSQYSTSAKLPATLDFGFRTRRFGFAQASRPPGCGTCSPGTTGTPTTTRTPTTCPRSWATTTWVGRP
ncbi:MAG: hypothetical protein IPL43_14065 [Micropruina sp.]|nr:hypothetical protein [Micropruina sp.]